MATTEEKWNLVTQDPRYGDLDTDKKEIVRQRFFEKNVFSDPRYSALPQSRRLEVRKRFDDFSKIEPESMGQDLMRKGKKVVAAVAPIAKKVGEAVSGAVDLSKVGSDIEDIESTGVKLPWNVLPNVTSGKQLSESFSKAGAYASEKVMPSEKQYALEQKIKEDPSSILSPVTQFDMARAAASGGVRAVSDAIASLIPETTIGASAYSVPVDLVMKYAGTTFFGHEFKMPWSKAKSGLSSSANTLGDQFEKMVTQENINQHVRGNIDNINKGPVKPLEVLAREEEKVKTQGELQAYEDHLKQLDDLSARGGEPQGDLYPQAKTNVSQLRDAARDRLQKLQDEPVRTDSLTRAEDGLQGYYRRKVDQARVYMMPSGPETEPQALLPAPDKPAGLLKAGEKTKSVPERPVASKPPLTPEQPQAAPAKASATTFKTYLAQAIDGIHPDQLKESRANTVGALMKGFGKYGFKGTEELTKESKGFIDSVIQAEWGEKMAREEKIPLSKAIPTEKLKQKGIDPLEVKAEAQRLKAEHDLKVGTANERRAELKSVTGGIGFHDPDPMTGQIPQKEEVLRNVPDYLRGNTKPDQAAQMAFDAGLIDSPDVNALFEYTKSFEGLERPRSANSFVPKAEYNLENQKMREAGFKPEPQSLPGMPQSEMGKSGIQPPVQQQEAGGLFDIKEKSSFDLTADLFKNIGEKGEIGLGGDVDPVKQAAKEAIIKELVSRARALGYETTQDVLLYAARNAPKEIQDALRKNLAPTLSAFDDHAYKEMEEARKGNPVAKKSMMDAAQRNYFQQKADIVKGVYKKFKANQQVVLFKDMDEGLMRLKNDLFIHDNYRKFSKDELAAQRWYTEGKSPKLESLTALGVPEDQAKRWLDLARNPTENMKKARGMTQIFEDEYHDVLSEFYDSVGYREDHVTRRWKRPEEYLDWEGRTLGNRPNFLKGAKLLSQAQGIDAGLESVSFDIREDLRASNNARVNVLSRIHAYQKLGASFGPDGMPAIIDESKDLLTQAKNAKITPHSGDAPASWIRTNDVPLLRGLAINPYYKSAMKFMMSRPFQGTAPEVLDFLSASTKATKLYGFFHGYTLGEMTASGISYRDVFSFGKNRNPLYRGLRYAVKGMTADLEGETLEWGTPAKGIKAIGKIYNSFMTGSGMLANRPLALDMAEHGFKFGSADEDMHGILRKALDAMEKNLTQKIGAGAAKGLTALPRGALDIQEAALWRYIRPISSMLVYETNLKDAVLKFNLEAAEGQKMSIAEIKQAVANQTSKEMGGISYARLMINPRTQQVLQWTMLAPGWTIGRALMGASVLEKGPEGRQARKQMAKLFVGWFFTSNMINYAQTKKHLGKGRYMWENPEGYRNQAFLSKEKDGSTRYLQMSKALTEIYDDLDVPKIPRLLAYKASPPVQAFVKAMNWATAKAYYPGIEPENPLMAAVHAYEPMITSGNSAYGGLPLKRGPSKNKVEAVLNEYYKGGMKNQALFQEAMQTGIEQGYDMSKLDRMVRANRTSKERKALLQ